MCQIHVRGRKVLLACSAWSYYRGARGRAFPGLCVQCIPNVQSANVRSYSLSLIKSFYISTLVYVRTLTQNRDTL